jgi:hypothetical protein
VEQKTAYITVIDTIGTPNAILHSFGMKVFDTAKTMVQQNQPIVIDFNGVRNLTSAFLHASVGNLVSLKPASNNLITWQGIENPQWEEKIKDAIELARNPEKQKAIESQINDLFNN